MPWIQVYDPLGNPWLSTAAAALPIVLLLGTLAILEWKAHWAALAGLAVGPCSCRCSSTACRSRAPPPRRLYGAAFGLLPIGWIIVNAVFLYNLTVETGQFEIVKASVADLSADRRIQALLIAFSFGAFIEGAAGFGTPVAICAALLMGLGFTPLYAAGLALIANTAPVAFGAIGTPIITLAAITGIPANDALGHGRPPAAVRVAHRAGLARGDDERMARPSRRVARRARVRRRVRDRAVLVEQLRRPRARRHRGRARLRSSPSRPSAVSGSRRRSSSSPTLQHSTHVQTSISTRALVVRAWMPWVFLSVMVMLWGLGSVKAFLNGGPDALGAVSRRQAAVGHAWRCSRPGTCHSSTVCVFRDFPVEAVAVDRARIDDPDYRNTRAEAARYTLNYLSATGTGILFAAILTAIYLRIPAGRVLAIAGMTFSRMRNPALHHRADAVARLRHALRRDGRHARARVHQDRVALSVLRRLISDGSAWRSPAPTRARTSSSAACRRSPPSSSV